jgi:type IV pilus assembly protein PilZ
VKPSTTGPKILRLAFSDTDVLRACYMPFLKRKGLFIPSAQTRKLGEKLFLVLRLTQQDLTVAGMACVCWITPEYSSDGQESGYGVHFDEGADALASAITAALGIDEASAAHTVSYTL